MKINHKLILIASLIQLLILSTYLHATIPVISNATGTIQQGQDITITGFNMLNEDKTDWMPQFQSGTIYGFEGTYANDVSTYGSDDSNKYNHAPDGEPMEMSYDTTVKLMGTSSYKGRIYGAHSYNASVGLYFDTTLQDIYVRMYSRWYSAGTISIWPLTGCKNLLTGVTDGSEQIYVEPGPLHNPINGYPSDMREYVGGYDVEYFCPYSWYTQNRWYCIEARFKVTIPKEVTVWVDGVQYVDDTNVDATTINGILFNMVNINGTGADFDLTCWTDNFTISSSRINPTCMVEVGNTSTYNELKVVKQALTYLSETSVSFKLDLTGLSTGPYYVWITDNQSNRSSGYELNIYNRRQGSSSSSNSSNCFISSTLSYNYFSQGVAYLVLICLFLKGSLCLFKKVKEYPWQ
jgi:hypothetical protein